MSVKLYYKNPNKTTFWNKIFKKNHKYYTPCNKRNDCDVKICITKENKSDRDKCFFQWKKYNKFHDKGFELNHYLSAKIPKPIVKAMFYGDKENKVTDLLKKLKNSKIKKYKIWQNASFPYVVYIEPNNTVSIYTNKFHDDYFFRDWHLYIHDILTKSVTNDKNSDIGKWLTYTKLVKKYKPSEIFIGKSEATEMTEYEGTNSPEYDGNSILLKLNNNNYVWIGEEIYTFSMEKGEKVVKLCSPVGPSGVPYPFIITTNNVYFLLCDDRLFLAKELFSKKVNFKKNVDMYSIFYDDLKKHTKQGKKIKNLKLISSVRF